MQEEEVVKVGHVRQFVNLDMASGDVCATGCGRALELMKVSSVHLAVARETLCTRTTASAGAHNPHLPTAPNASTRTPPRRRSSSTNPTVFCLSQCALAIARVISVANGENQRPQPVLQRNGVLLEEANQPTKTAQRIAHLAQSARRCPETLPPTFM